MQFLIVVEAPRYSGIYFCEPPQTVICELGPISIGAGAGVVEPLFPMIIPGISPLKPTILKLAYLMYKAKKGQAAFVGGPTDLFVMNRAQNWKVIPPYEMEAAELAMGSVDAVLNDCCAGLFCCDPDADQKKSLAKFDRFFMTKMGVLRSITFPSLVGFDPTMP